MADTLSFLDSATWLNPPPKWSLDADGLSVTTGKDTDFWQDTFYGFRRDNGHCLAAPIAGDFSAVATFSGAYETLYDQAGLMLRIDPDNWVKAGIELEAGAAHFSTVVTRAGRSDWSMLPVAAIGTSQSIRLTRVGGAIAVHYPDTEGGWRLMRLADFPGTDDATVGPMACSPQRAGFTVRFSAFTVGAPAPVLAEA